MKFKAQDKLNQLIETPLRSSQSIVTSRKSRGRAVIFDDEWTVHLALLLP